MYTSINIPIFHLYSTFLQLQQQHNQFIQQQTRFVPNENFFLFRNQSMRERNPDGKDHFNSLSDEIILQIFKWLPKKTLLRCGFVSRRFNRCASDESLWTRLDLGGRSIKSGAMENILKRGVVILRLAQAEVIILGKCVINIIYYNYYLSIADQSSCF